MADVLTPVLHQRTIGGFSLSAVFSHLISMIGFSPMTQIKIMPPTTWETRFQVSDATAVQ